DRPDKQSTRRTVRSEKIGTPDRSLQSTAIISRESEYSREGGKDRREIFRGSGRIRILRPRPVSRKNSTLRRETRGIPRCRVRTIRRRHRLRPRQRQIILFLPRRKQNRPSKEPSQGVWTGKPGCLRRAQVEPKPRRVLRASWTSEGVHSVRRHFPSSSLKKIQDSFQRVPTPLLPGTEKDQPVSIHVLSQVRRQRGSRIQSRNARQEDWKNRRDLSHRRNTTV